MRTQLLTALAIAVGAVAAGAPPAAATQTHQIEIDGSALFSRHFVVSGVTGWLAADQVQTVTVEEGRRYQIRAGAELADFTFSVDSAGRIGYESYAEPYLDGADTSRLTLVGVDTTIDARYLSGSGVLLAHVPPDNQDWLRYRTVRLLPSPVYTWQQGSGVVVNVRAALRRDGTWTYDEDYAGYMGGDGTRTLTFYGYPLLVDARAAGGTGVAVHNVWGLGFSPSGVQTAVLLPASTFVLQIRGGELSRGVFAMTDDGELTYDAALPFAVDRFDGMRRLTVTTPL
jgi:hypothetical protein